jgi:hypothetical protein
MASSIPENLTYNLLLSGISAVRRFQVDVSMYSLIFFIISFYFNPGFLSSTRIFGCLEVNA